MRLANLRPLGVTSLRSSQSVNLSTVNIIQNYITIPKVVLERWGNPRYISKFCYRGNLYLRPEQVKSGKDQKTITSMRAGKREVTTLSPYENALLIKGKYRPVFESVGEIVHLKLEGAVKTDVSLDDAEPVRIWLSEFAPAALRLEFRKSNLPNTFLAEIPPGRTDVLGVLKLNHMISHPDKKGWRLCLLDKEPKWGDSHSSQTATSTHVESEAK